MYKHLVSAGIEYEIINKLFTFIEEEAFDSESIQYDEVNDNKDIEYKGNIQIYIKNAKCIKSIQQIIQYTKCMYMYMYIYFICEHKKKTKTNTRKQKHVLFRLVLVIVFITGHIMHHLIEFQMNQNGI